MQMCCSGSKKKERGFLWMRDLETFVTAAINHGRLNILEWLREGEVLSFNENAIISAVASRRSDVMKYFYELGLHLHVSPDGLSTASKQIVKDMLSAVDQGSQQTFTDENSCLLAACMGSSVMLKLLLAMGCPWNGNTLKVIRLFSKNSAMYRDAEEWAMQNGYPEPET